MTLPLILFDAIQYIHDFPRSNIRLLFFIVRYVFCEETFLAEEEVRKTAGGLIEFQESGIGPFTTVAPEPVFIAP